MSESYNEALHALIQTTNKVAHVDDTPARCIYEENYPIDIEKMLFELIEKGDVNGVSAEANRFFDWMEENYGRYINDIKLKSLEFVLWAEHIAYENGGMVYHFRDRQDYFPMIIELKNLEEVRAWFVDKMGNACRNVAVKKEEQSVSVVERARKYIDSIIRIFLWMTFPGKWISVPIISARYSKRKRGRLL